MPNEKLIYAADARKAILRADPKLAYCIDDIKGVDAVEVVLCEKCKRHLKCPIEERFHRVESRYCCLGERREGE